MTNRWTLVCLSTLQYGKTVFLIFNVLFKTFYFLNICIFEIRIYVHSKKIKYIL